MAEKSLADLERTLDAFWQFCGGKRLTRITPTMVERYFSKRLREVSASKEMSAGTSVRRGDDKLQEH